VYAITFEPVAIFAGRHLPPGIPSQRRHHDGEDEQRDGHRRTRSIITVFSPRPPFAVAIRIARGAERPMLERRFKTTHETDASDVPDDNTPLPFIGRLLEKPAHFVWTNDQHLDPLGRASAGKRARALSFYTTFRPPRK
jgi:hypothetical protein